jgi:hypothetical protein
MLAAIGFFSKTTNFIVMVACLPLSINLAVASGSTMDIAIFVLAKTVVRKFTNRICLANLLFI